MSKDTLNEREFELVNIIGAKLAQSQRDLSQRMDLSLGQTNMLIRRLVSKGYIRISQLNKKRVMYLLTPKGIAEKMRQSVRYTLKTINSIGLIKEAIRGAVIPAYEEGERNYIVVGKSDFALLIEMVLREMNLNDYTIAYVDELPQEEQEALILICREDIKVNGDYPNKYINLIHQLAKDEKFVNQDEIEMRV